MERAGEGAAAVGLTPLADPGAVFDDELEAAPAEARPGPPAETDQRLSALERELATTKANLEETRRSEQFWAGRARGVSTPEVPDAPDEDEDPEQPGVSPFADETADRFLDDVSTQGTEALRKRGFASRDEVAAIVGAAVKQVREEVKGTLEQQNRHMAIDAELGKFPELLADSRALKANPAAQVSRMYELTQGHYRQMLADDPKMKNSPAALLSAARMAKKELDLEAKHNPRQQQQQTQTRRDRVAAQMGERDAGAGGDEGGGDEELSPTAREVVGNLSRYLTVKDAKGKVTVSAEENYRRHVGKNGR